MLYNVCSPSIHVNVIVRFPLDSAEEEVVFVAKPSEPAVAGS